MLTSPINTSYVFPRRVSFDLSHNKVHLLPTLEECRDAAKRRSREEWQRKSLNEDMLSEDIISEIQEDCSATSRNTDSEEEDREFEPKSCLKKPPVVVTAVPTTSSSSSSNSSSSSKKRMNSKKNQKKRKRSNSQVDKIVSEH